MSTRTATLTTDEGDDLTLAYGDPVLDGRIALQIVDVEGHEAHAHLTAEEAQALAVTLGAALFGVMFPEGAPGGQAPLVPTTKPLPAFAEDPARTAR